MLRRAFQVLRRIGFERLLEGLRSEQRRQRGHVANRQLYEGKRAAPQILWSPHIDQRRGVLRVLTSKKCSPVSE